MHLVLTAAITELLQLKTAGDGLLVLRRRVIALLALRAFQRDDFPHICFPSVSSVQFAVDSGQFFLLPKADSLSRPTFFLPTVHRTLFTAT